MASAAICLLAVALRMPLSIMTQRAVPPSLQRSGSPDPCPSPYWGLDRLGLMWGMEMTNSSIVFLLFPQRERQGLLWPCNLGNVRILGSLPSRSCVKGHISRFKAPLSTCVDGGRAKDIRAMGPLVPLRGPLDWLWKSQFFTLLWNLKLLLPGGEDSTAMGVMEHEPATKIMAFSKSLLCCKCRPGLHLPVADVDQVKTI